MLLNNVIICNTYIVTLSIVRLLGYHLSSRELFPDNQQLTEYNETE